ncbi:MAG: TolC family protein [Bacteroidetes bacterium]|nr:TolC family protein [Bacteroidota bacterium]
MIKTRYSAATVLLFLLLFLSTNALAQLTLEQCYELSKNNYPLIKQKELISQSKEYSVANARSGYLPQFSLAAQATYQSDVTRVPIDLPGLSIKPLSKDQYKIYGEVNQTILDGGTIRQNAALSENSAQVEDQKLEVELYKIKDRVNQLFFGVLLLDEQLTQTLLVKKDLQSSLSRIQASIQNGTAFRSNEDILQAEILKTDQRIIETKSVRKAYVEMLGIFINQSLDESTKLITPSIQPVNESADINRPELNLYNAQRLLYNSQYLLSNTRNQPKLGFFLQAGYGKPALNVLKNEFDTYYLGGFRFSWNFSGFYNTHRDKQLLEVNNQLVDTQRDFFLFNTKLALRQNSNEINKLNELMRVDDQIIALRLRIKDTAKVQFENGVITANDYLRELNAEDQAKQNQTLHRVQLMLAQVNYQNTVGN